MVQVLLHCVEQRDTVYIHLFTQHTLYIYIYIHRYSFICEHVCVYIYQHKINPENPGNHGKHIDCHHRFLANSPHSAPLLRPRCSLGLARVPSGSYVPACLRCLLLAKLRNAPAEPNSRVRRVIALGECQRLGLG